MPKSRRRPRKGPKSRPSRARPETVGPPPGSRLVWSKKGSGRTEERPVNGAGRELSRDSIAELMPPSRRALATVVAISPLPIGAWVAGGLIVQNQLLFASILSILILCHYAKNVSSFADRIPFPESFVQLIHLAIAILVLVFQSGANNLAASGLLAGVALLTRLSDGLEMTGARPVLLNAAAIVARMSLLGMLGAYCQVDRLVLGTLVLGLVPGSVLAAASIAENAQALERTGWTRTFPHTDKEGETKNRPGGVTRAYSITLLLGPTLPVALAPFHFLPAPFVLSAFPLIRAPGLCQAFSEELLPDEEIAGRTTKLAALTAVVMLVLGVLATLGLM